MPQQDGTGLSGQGARTGCGAGNCNGQGGAGFGHGAGHGAGRGAGRGGRGMGGRGSEPNSAACKPPSKKLTEKLGK